jgi:hypothetical protein
VGCGAALPAPVPPPQDLLRTEMPRLPSSSSRCEAATLGQLTCISFAWERDRTMGL